MGRRLVDNVAVVHPSTGATKILLAGSEVPGWATPLITNEGVYEPEPDEPGPTGDTPPPKGGPGSGKDAWVAFAAGKVEVPADATREDIVAALEAAGIATE